MIILTVEYIKNNFNVTDDDMISMHIRRTDYVYSSDFHHPLELDYYKKAAVQYIIFFLFSQK